MISLAYWFALFAVNLVTFISCVILYNKLEKKKNNEYSMLSRPDGTLYQYIVASVAAHQIIEAPALYLLIEVSKIAIITEPFVFWAVFGLFMVSSTVIASMFALVAHFFEVEV